MAQIRVGLVVTDIPELQEQPWAVAFAALQQTSSVQGNGGGTAAEPTTPAFIFQTSGTTGAAKWIQVTHGQSAAAIEDMREMGYLDYAARQTVYITPPLSHVWVEQPAGIQRRRARRLCYRRWGPPWALWRSAARTL